MKEGANTIAEMRALAEKCAEELVGTCRAIYELSDPEYVDALDNSPAFCARLHGAGVQCVQLVA